MLAAFAVGVFVLARAFPEGQSTEPVSQPPTTTPPTTSPTEAPEETTPPRVTPSPDVRGVRLAVLNGTEEDLLAARTKDELEKLGYRVVDVGDAQNNYDVTTLFYRGPRLDAQHLRDTVFEGARLERAPAALNPDVQIIVALGEEWAATH